MTAAENGMTETMKLLLDEGADLEAKGKDGKTALICPTAKGRAEAMQLLVAKGADVNARDDEGENALIYAAEKGKTEPILVLLDNGADIEGKGKGGKTAFVTVTAQGETRAMESLVFHGGMQRHKLFGGHSTHLRRGERRDRADHAATRRGCRPRGRRQAEQDSSRTGQSRRAQPGAVGQARDAEMRRLLTKAAQAGFTPQEKHQFKVDATFLNSNPLRINRIMNVYNFYRTVQTHLGVDEDVTQEQELAGLLRTAGHNNREHTQLRFRAVLHRWVVLTEQWPFRGDVGAADVGRREAARWCRGAARRQCTRKDSRTGAWDGAQ